MKTLKEYARNKVRPKGSMVEGYAIEETLRFCTKYLQDFMPTKRRVWDEKKTNVWLTRWLKEMGAQEIECQPSRHGPLFYGSMMLVCHFKFYTKYL
jgi:hypothetical protein